MGSVWGNAVKLSIFGESHGGGIGCVLDGFPAGVPYDEAFILAEMDRRAPGKIVSPQLAEKRTSPRSFPAFLRAKPLARRFPVSLKIPIPVPRIIAI